MPDPLRIADARTLEELHGFSDADIPAFKRMMVDMRADGNPLQLPSSVATEAKKKGFVEGVHFDITRPRAGAEIIFHHGRYERDKIFRRLVMSNEETRKFFDALADVMKDPGKAALAEAGMKISAVQADHTTKMHALAYIAADKLAYTTDDLESLGEDFADAVEDIEFLRRLDLLVFCCVKCNWWKRQRENGTPKAAEWVCKECVADGM